MNKKTCYLCKDYDKPDSFLDGLVLTDGDEVVMFNPFYCPCCGRQLKEFEEKDMKKYTRQEFMATPD